MSVTPQVTAAGSVNLSEKLKLVHDVWHPHTLGQFNGQDVLLSRMQGEFVFHHHDVTDEFFLVIRGGFEMHFRDGVTEVKAGEFIIVPRGVEHKPVARGEAEVLLIHSADTSNTGNVVNSLTRGSSPAI